MFAVVSKAFFKNSNGSPCNFRRGAQAGGVITYVKGSGGSLKGVRSRVVNGKRTNLSTLIANKVSSNDSKAGLFDGHIDSPRLYAGHTRFATTSKVTLDGTHPHMWSPPAVYEVYTGDWSTPKGLKKRRLNVEVYVCHNGDFDGLEIDGSTFELGAMLPFLARATGCPCPSAVDTMGIAGTMDLMRCQGSWFHAVRLAFLMGGGVDHGTPSLDYEVPPQSQFLALAKSIAVSVDVSLCFFFFFGGGGWGGGPGVIFLSQPVLGC